MIEWIREINWILIFSATAGVIVGTEIGRRRAKNKGGIFSFLPLRTHRLLNAAIGMGAALLIEAARVAVRMPNEFHVWMLIFATSAAFILCATQSGLEFNSAKRALKASEGGGVNH